MSDIDIIVTVYNIRDYIGRCLESIQKQTFSDYNCIIVNDGSTDDSVDVISPFLSDERFHLYNKVNGGNGDARNYGLKYVTSEYVMLPDGDDYLEYNCLETVMNELKRDPVDMIVFGYNQYYLHTEMKEQIHLSVEDGIYNTNTKKDIIVNTPNAPWNKVYRSELFKKNGIFFPVGYRHSDYGTIPKLVLEAEKIKYMDIPLYNYLIDRPNNISTAIDRKLYHIINMSEEILHYFDQKGLLAAYKEELYCLVWRNVIVSLRKSMLIDDKQFVYGFIQDVFKMKKRYFSDCEDRYNIRENKSDIIYMNESLCKLYYMFRKIRKRGGNA